jgi:hypothetical protein
MARQLVINIWCDACAFDDDTNHTTAEEFTLAFNGGPARTLALCADHTGSILAPLARLLETAPTATSNAAAKKAAAPTGELDLGFTQTGMPRKVAVRAAATNSPWVCPYGDGFHVNSRGTLGKHLKETHQTDVISAREQFPEWAARLGSTVQHKTSSPAYRRRECPAPGCGFHTMTAQGFTMHLKAHRDISATERERIITEERTHAIGA